MSAASGGNSEPKQGQRSQSARGFCPQSTMRVPQPDIIEHFGNADAVPQLPERCLSRKAGICGVALSFQMCCNSFRPSFRPSSRACTSSGVLSPQKLTRSAVRTARSGAPIAIRVWLGSPLSQAEPPEI